ncbi:SpoIIE family protein phosphatase [Blastococcus saxobsidens]|uniref:Serine phosphatase RsbU, regulator of sigma subunit (Modular protein) n=1 Tax=Blastococcus saxobsidens (strain DD2) TaxID=1146883 RepID=H6RM10_BLASD|nr:SpoIIE family protein phosphatase [Blastococcus saxobsidens]CCG01252.1 Serine phosphatase RsbU, regulator of sigma subunit (modular protein) [Blastococcus saxobsidens DD2]
MAGAASTVPPGLPGSDPLTDPLRVAAARRLLLEVPGPAAFDRLSALAARLLDVGHVKVTLFTDRDVVVGGHGLPAGVVGGPALLTGALSAITVRQGSSLRISSAADDERVAGLPAVTSGEVRSYLGAPLLAASGQVVGALAGYDAAPREWSDDAEELLEQLAASVVAELELSAAQSAVGTSRAWLEVALEASSVGIWERDLRTGTIHWDERCAALFGVDSAMDHESLDQVLTEHVHPEDHAAVEEAMRVAIEERGDYTVEFRVRREDGVARWVLARGRVVADASGAPARVLGTVLDVTEARGQAQRRLTAVERAAAIAEVAAELANAARLEDLADVVVRAAHVLGAQTGALAIVDGPGGPLRLHMAGDLAATVREQHPEIGLVDGVVLPMDDALPVQYAARRGRRLLLSDPAETIARFPAMAGVVDLVGLRALAAVPLRVEGRVLGTFLVVWTVDHDFLGDDVEVLEALAAQIALSVSRLQADAERAAAVAAMAQANERLRLLAEAGRVLSGTLDINQQIGRLASLVVPELADWCWIVVTDEQGRLHDVASSHRDAARRSEVEEYVRAMVATMSEASAARRVTTTGSPVMLPVIDWDDVARALPDAGARERFARLGAGSGVAVPLVARGQVLGALGLFTREERGPLGDREVDTAVEIGRRAGLALHQARLYGQQRELADALQRSMLTEPPQPEHGEIVVRYVPAAEGAEIGGDWYDAFLQRGGATVLAIGDVVGHDTRAAAAMGQVRGLLRGISYSSGGSPAEVLSELDRAVQGLALDTMATALVAHLEPEPGDETGRVRLRWANAGHPPPALLASDGSVVLLEGKQADLLLGVAPETVREDHVAVLAPGSTVLLYTDGLVERRDRDIDAGTQQLLEVLGDCEGLPLGELCDRVLERMFLPDAEDDVAVLAVRLHPEG